MPQVSIDNLFTLLKKPRQRLSVITQSDTFLSVWAEQTIIEYWHKEYIKERLRLHEASSQASLTLTLTQKDLFSTKKTWLLACSKPALAKEWQLDQIIQQSLTQTENDFVIIIANLSGGATKSAWYKNLCNLGLHLSTKAIPSYKVPNWLAQYSKLINKPLPMTLCNNLAEQNHFHLPALAQLVKQLQIQDLQPPYNQNSLASCKLSAPSNQSIFEVLDDICQGNIQGFNKAISQNYPQDVLINLYWVLIKRMRQILTLYEKHRLHNTPLSQIMQQENVWTKQQKVFLRCLKTPHKKLYTHYLALCNLEWVLKGRYPGNFTTLLIQQCQQLCYTIYAH